VLLKRCCKPGWQGHLSAVFTEKVASAAAPATSLAAETEVHSRLSAVDSALDFATSRSGMALHLYADLISIRVRRGSQYSREFR